MAEEDLTKLGFGGEQEAQKWTEAADSTPKAGVERKTAEATGFVAGLRPLQSHARGAKPD